MDILYFLRERLSFIRRHYDAAVTGFEETKRLIEAGAPPYDATPIHEDEPPFLQEWMDADASIQVIGLGCTSLLSDALKLYLGHLQRNRIGFEFDDEGRRAIRRSWVAAHREALGEILATDWMGSGIDFDLIEQVVLARNRAQHGTDLFALRPAHDAAMLRRHALPHFAESREVEAWIAAGRPEGLFGAPGVTVSREALFAAIAEVERLGSWVDANLARADDWRRSRRSGDS